MGSDTYTYDANGNQTSRTVGDNSYMLEYDAENRMTGMTVGSGNASFVYDGDGNRVKGTVGGVTTAYIGNYFEWVSSTSNMKKYYYAGSTRVAMRTGTPGTVNYLLGDHLGSTAITTDSSGLKSAEVRYYPWGTERYTSGTTQTTYKFTGQRYESGIGLYYYGARWYDSAAGRFIQADTMIPQQQGGQAWGRYAYTNNNPVRYTDPTGHRSCEEDGYNCNTNNTTATKQAFGLVVNWYFETGLQSQTFGPSEPITQEVRYDEGMDKFREQWAAAGNPLPYTDNITSDERNRGSLLERGLNGAWVLFREHVIELGGSILGFGSKDPEGHIDAVGGTIGSLDQVTVSDAGDGQVRFEVYNEMGWASATRVPGTNISLKRDRDRSEWGPGGTITQNFYWYETRK